MVTLVNRAYVGTATTGTGTLTLGAAEAGYQTFADAGVTLGQKVRYTIEDGTAWEVGTGTYTPATETNLVSPTYVAAGSVFSQESTPWGVAFSSDGTKMYVVGTGADTVFQYTLATPWDVSTASYSTKSFSVSAQDSAPTGLAFNNDGTKMYIGGDTTNALYQYTLATAWDVSTASYDSVSVSASWTQNPAGLTFSPDGTKLYTGDGNDYRYYAYHLALGTAFDLSTLNTTPVASSPFTNPLYSMVGIAFNSDGSKAYLLDRQNRYIARYTTATAYSFVGMTYDNVQHQLVSANTPRGFFVGNNGFKMYVAAGSLIMEYTVGNIESLTRTVTESSTGSALNLSGSAKVFVSAASDDLVGHYKFTASGAVVEGDPVAVNSNGTVSKVAQPAAVPGLTAQSAQSDVDPTPIYVSIGSDKLISFYESTANDDLRAVVVDVSTGTPSYGTPVTVLTPTSANSGDVIEAKYDSGSGVVFLLYVDFNGSTYDFYVRAATVSGTTITLGTAVNLNSASSGSASNNATLSVDPADLSFLYVCWDGTAKVCSFSGTAITVQNTYTTPHTNMRRLRSAYDPDSARIGVFYANASNSNYLTMFSVQITGTTAGSFGTPGVLNSESYSSGGFDVADYGDTGWAVFSSAAGALQIGQAYPGNFYIGTTGYTDANYVKVPTWKVVYSAANSQYLLSYTVQDTSTSPFYPVYLRYISGGFSAGTAVFVQRQNDSGSFMFSWDASTRKGLVYARWPSATGTFTVANTVPPSTNLKFVGIAAADISNGASGPITTVGGINDGVTGLTTGTTYYVSTTGTLTTTNTGVKAGRALSATTILVDTAMDGPEMNAYIGSL